MLQICRKLGKNDISEKKPQVHLIIIREGPPIKKIPSIFPLVHFIWPPTIKYERVLPNALYNGFMATSAFGHTVCSSAPVSIKSSQSERVFAYKWMVL